MDSGNIEALAFSLAVFSANFMLKVTPFSGFLAVFCGLNWLFCEDKTATRANGWAIIAAIALIVGPVGWFTLPYAVSFLLDSPFRLFPQAYTYMAFGGVVGLGAFVVWQRWLYPSLHELGHRFRRRSSSERNRRTDIRTIGDHLPKSHRGFDPRQHMPTDPRKNGVFIGLNERNRPVLIPYATWRKSHVQVIGSTGFGKGVSASVMLSQSLRAGEAVVVLDPKNDEWAPHVLRQEAQRAGVPFALVDLRDPAPQLDLLAGMLPAELEELLISGFSLSERGEAADFYRISDRRAARDASQLAGEVSSVAEMAAHALVRAWEENASGFVGKIDELALVGAINAPGGLNLADVVRDGGCVYVIGSMRNQRIVTVQRMLLVRMLQLVEQRDRVSGDIRPVRVFLDELKYHLSRPALEGLGAARDKGLSLIMAHQSLGDLRDCPADLNPDSVEDAIIENCSIRVAYRVQSSDTAEWMAKRTGEILVDDEVRKIDRTAAGADLVGAERTIRQATRYRVDVNMMLSLPSGVAVICGQDEPQFAHIAHIPAEKSPLELHRAPERATPVDAEPFGAMPNVDI